jgi:hypothetical protein
MSTFAASNFEAASVLKRGERDVDILLPTT